MPKLHPYIIYVNKRKAEVEEAGEALSGGIKVAVARFEEEWTKMNAEERLPYVQEANSMNANRFGSQSQTELASPFSTAPKPPEDASTRKKVSADSIIVSGLSLPSSIHVPYLRKPRTVAAILNTTNATKLDRMANKLPSSRDLRPDEGYIQDLLTMNKPANLFFVLINCSYYCRADNSGLYVPSEIGLACFSFQKGIVDNYWTLVDPKMLPMGMTKDARDNQMEFKIPLPPFEPRFQDLQKIINNIRLFLQRYKHAEDDFTNVYCITPQAKLVKGCLDWLSLFGKCVNLKAEYRIRSLSTLVRKLDMVASAHDPRKRMERIIMEFMKGPCQSQHSIKAARKELTQGEAMQLIQGKLSDWAFRKEICCPYHRSAASIGIPSCSLNIVNRYSMHIMRSIARKFGIVPTMGHHQPFQNPEDDVKKINHFLITWGYLPQFLLYEDLDEYKMDYLGSDDDWYPTITSKSKGHSTNANVEASDSVVHDAGEDAAPKYLSLIPSEINVDVDWDGSFRLDDGKEFTIEIVRAQRKEVMDSIGRGDHLFW